MLDCPSEEVGCGRICCDIIELPNRRIHNVTGAVEAILHDLGALPLPYPLSSLSFVLPDAEPAPAIGERSLEFQTGFGRRV